MDTENSTNAAAASSDSAQSKCSTKIRCFRNKGGFKDDTDRLEFGGRITTLVRNDGTREDVSNCYSIENCEFQVREGNWDEFSL